MYQEIFNSDTDWYGGTNITGDEVHSVQQKEHNFDHSLTITLPPLAAVFMQKVGN
jgi:1,4-alpha-glucan branching enzyme